MTVFRSESLNHSLKQLIENQSPIYSGNKEVTVYMSEPFNHLRKWFIQTLWLVLELINWDFTRGSQWSHYLWHWMNSSGHRVTTAFETTVLVCWHHQSLLLSNLIWIIWILDKLPFTCRHLFFRPATGYGWCFEYFWWADRHHNLSVQFLRQMSSVSGLDAIHMVTLFNSQPRLIFQWRFCPVGINQVCTGL